MQLLRRFYNRCMVPGFLANSLPKAGTHLLTKVLSLLPGIRLNADPIAHLGPHTLASLHQTHDSADTVPVDVTWPRPVSRDTCRRALRQIKRGQFRSIHAPYSAEMCALLKEEGMKTVMILRDPRDVVVSAGYYHASTPISDFYDIYKPLSDSDRIMLSIHGRERSEPGGLRITSIAETCQSVLPWLKHPSNYTTHFHRLVGPQGGGSAEEQMTELKNLASHLGCAVRQQDLDKVAREAFGGTRTFRSGTSGEWRKRFSEEHKQAFKEAAGTLLIELGYEKDLNW